jgi:hypothetical protein
MMHIPKRLLCSFTLTVTIVTLPALASDGKQQEAIVTFYSHGNRWTTGLPGSNHGIFVGKVFSGRDALFSFLEGFPAKNNLVIGLRFPPGEYAFSASFGKPSPQKGVSLRLDPGGRYFFRAQSESRGIVEIEIDRGRLDQVSCETASEETKNAKPVAVKKVAKQFAASIDPTLLPITCP